MKITALTLSLLVAIGSLTPASSGQEPAVAAQELPGARGLIDNYLKITGIAEKVPAIRSMRSKGKIELSGMGISGTVETFQARPNRTLTIANIEGIGKSMEGYDGKVAFAVQGMMGPMLLEGAAAAQMERGALFDGQLYPAELYEKMETVGQVKFEGTECWKVHLVFKPFESDDPEVSDPEKTLAVRTRYEYYAVDGGMLMGQELTQASPMGEVAATVVISQYTDHGGVKLPGKVVQKVPGVNIVMTISEVAFDDVSDDEFALPKEVKALLEKKPEPAGDGGN